MIVPLYILGICLSISSILFSIIRFLLYPKRRFARIPMIILLLHFSVYQLSLIIINIYNYDIPRFIKIGEWSNILWLHTIITILSLEIYGYIRDKGGNLWTIKQ